MMNLRTGVDLIEIERVKSAFDRYGERFLNRIYTRQELNDVGNHFPSLATRFAAKEAVSKALGTGIGDVRWLDIEILRNLSGEPSLVLHNNALDISSSLGVTNWSLSLSHTNTYAIAMVVAIGNDKVQLST